MVRPTRFGRPVVTLDALKVRKAGTGGKPVAVNLLCVVLDVCQVQLFKTMSKVEHFYITNY